MSEQSLPIDAFDYWLKESAVDRPALAALVPDDWNRGARDHPSHETSGPEYLVS
jgi:hypothetical protein